MSNKDTFISFGKHKGERYSRIPLSYLKWIVNEKEFEHPRAQFLAEQELIRRGHIESDNVHISSHAIDKASLRLYDYYVNDRYKNEGLNSWLIRKCETILKIFGKLKGKFTDMAGITWVFENNTNTPVLKTVYMREKK